MLDVLEKSEYLTYIQSRKGKFVPMASNNTYLIVSGSALSKYLDDIKRFTKGLETSWRSKNDNVCDSPNLYFPISPSRTLKTCCDYEATKDIFIYDKNFPELYFSGKIQEIVYPITKVCGGCMYGSYPEITITARYLKAFIERVKYFNFKPPKIKKYSSEQLQAIASEILNEQD